MYILIVHNAIYDSPRAFSRGLAYILPISDRDIYTGSQFEVALAREAAVVGVLMTLFLGGASENNKFRVSRAIYSQNDKNATFVRVICGSPAFRDIGQGRPRLIREWKESCSTRLPPIPVPNWEGNFLPLHLV